MNAPTVYTSLKGKSVFVTGGATGIGAAMVAAFYHQGARVGFVDLDEEAAKALVADLGDGVERFQPWFAALDVSNTAALQKAIADFAAIAGGQLDALINNVANDVRHSIDEVSKERWHWLMAINLDCAFFACQAALPFLRGAGGGAIVNLSSINALLGPAGMPAYVTAKAGIVGMTKALATDLGADKIRVNTILPGWVVTEKQLATWLTPEAEENWMKEVALKDRIQPEDVANLALFLTSDDSRMITGQQFVIDGGRT